MSIEIHTIRFGSADWILKCAPTLDAWAARHQLPLHIWDRSTADEKDYPDVKFCQVDMLEQFLAGNSDQMMYVDADVYVHPDAPRPDLGPGMHIRPHGRRSNNPYWMPWCLEHFGRKPKDGGNYRNAGVWVVDRDAARRLLSVIKQPYIEGVMEQNHWNWWIMEAEEKGLKVWDLSPVWNSYPRQTQPAWFFHIFGSNKLSLLSFYERRGLIPREDRIKRTPQVITKNAMKRNVIVQGGLKAPKKPPDRAWPMFMDQLHLDLLKGLLEAHRPRKAMEIGSHKGVSTQVFLDALDAGVIDSLVIVEPFPTLELETRIKNCKRRDRVKMETDSSWEILEAVDFVLIDGHHGMPAYADLAQALALHVPVIALHDTNSNTLGLGGCFGSEGAWDILEASPLYECKEDKEKRDGMWTERGFGWAVLSTKVGACKNLKTASS
jgi:hypothetical protein